jgi:hypothetical protein
MTSERPHWWAVLSVAIALMALVAAISGPKQLQRSGRAMEDAPHLGPSSRERSSGRVDRVSRAVQDALASSPPITARPSIVQLPQASTPVETDTNSALPVPALPPATDTFPPGSYQGYFESPWVVSTTYPISGDGILTATAIWSQPIEMTLTVSCPLLVKTETGGSGVSVALTQPGTSCSVSLSEPFSSPGIVDYAIEVSS